MSLANKYFTSFVGSYKNSVQFGFQFWPGKKLVGVMLTDYIYLLEAMMGGFCLEMRRI